MPITTIILGVCLIFLGVVGYFATGRQSITAMIPAFFGVVFVLLGIIASRGPRARKHAMHVAAALALLGFFATLRGVGGVVRMMQGQEVARPQAAISQATMAGLCLVFVIFCVRSFIVARRQRRDGVE